MNTKPTHDEIHSIQVLPISVLVAAANQQLDLNVLAKEELAARGLDTGGKWVGFAKAKEIHGVKP